MKDLLYRLFFTRDDDLDLLQIFFLVMIVFFMIAFSLDSMGRWNVKTAAWTIFGTVFGTLAISGTPTWIAKLLAQRPPEGLGGQYGGYYGSNNDIGGGGSNQTPEELGDTDQSPKLPVPNKTNNNTEIG